MRIVLVPVDPVAASSFNAGPPVFKLVDVPVCNDAPAAVPDIALACALPIGPVMPSVPVKRKGVVLG